MKYYSDPSHTIEPGITRPACASRKGGVASWRWVVRLSLGRSLDWRPATLNYTVGSMPRACNMGDGNINIVEMRTSWFVRTHEWSNSRGQDVRDLAIWESCVHLITLKVAHFAHLWNYVISLWNLWSYFTLSKHIFSRLNRITNNNLIYGNIIEL